MNLFSGESWPDMGLTIHYIHFPRVNTAGC